MGESCHIAVLVLFALGLATGVAQAQDQEISVASLNPVVVATQPQAGDLNVDPSLAEIKVTFSKDMLDQAWSPVQISKESFPKIEGKPSYKEDHRTWVVGVKLEPNKTYAIWLNSNKFMNFKDKDHARPFRTCWCSKPRGNSKEEGRTPDSQVFSVL